MLELACVAASPDLTSRRVDGQRDARFRNAAPRDAAARLRPPGRPLQLTGDLLIRPGARLS